MATVLIVLLFTGQSGATSITMKDFNSESACEAAAKIIHDRVRSYDTVTTSCLNNSLIKPSM
jgi:hypothetical protein